MAMRDSMVPVKEGPHMQRAPHRSPIRPAYLLGALILLVGVIQCAAPAALDVTYYYLPG